MDYQRQVRGHGQAADLVVDEGQGLRHWSRTGEAMLVLAGTVAFTVVVRERLPSVAHAVTEREAWFVLTASLAGLVTTTAVARMLEADRTGEALLLTSLMMLAAAAALPDVEFLVGLSALWVPWGAVALTQQTPRVAKMGEVCGCLRWTTATSMGALVSLGLLDGARGRPGAILIAPAVICPLLAVAFMRPAGLTMTVLRIGLGFVLGVSVARHAGLGDGTAKPLFGTMTGVALIGLAMRASAVMHDGRGPAAEG